MKTKNENTINSISLKYLSNCFGCVAFSESLEPDEPTQQQKGVRVCVCETELKCVYHKKKPLNACLLGAEPHSLKVNPELVSTVHLELSLLTDLQLKEPASKFGLDYMPSKASFNTGYTNTSSKTALNFVLSIISLSGH